jgi:multicomponent Na+:H+ antiporter subunit E
MGTWRTRWTGITIQFVLLFIFWLLLSGTLHLKEILIGIGAAAVVTWLTNDLLYNPVKKRLIEPGTKYILASGLRLLAYIPWLVWAIIKANIQIAIIILKPSLPIDPIILQFSTNLSKNVSLVTLANSITLTPGTLTVDMKNKTYVIHCLVREAAGDLESGLMQNKVGAVFDDNKDTAPATTWTHSWEETE